jgi:hypothetical protein
MTCLPCATHAAKRCSSARASAAADEAALYNSDNGFHEGRIRVEVEREGKNVMGREVAGGKDIECEGWGWMQMDIER